MRLNILKQDVIHAVSYKSDPLVIWQSFVAIANRLRLGHFLMRQYKKSFFELSVTPSKRIQNPKRGMFLINRLIFLVEAGDKVFRL
jgi:hypothetical protein